MRKTNNFNLTIPEGSDNVNILTQITPNFETIDNVMKDNENAGVQVATVLYSNNIHAITRTNDDASVMRFTATSRFTLGDTFTVDGVQVTALAPTGEQLPDGAFIVGSEVLAILKGTLLTVFAGAKASDSSKLNGQSASFYATKAEVDNAQELAEGAATIAQDANEQLNKNYTIDTNIIELNKYTRENPYVCETDVIIHAISSNGCESSVLAQKANGDYMYILLINENSSTTQRIVSCYLKKGMKIYGTISSQFGYVRAQKVL